MAVAHLDISLVELFAAGELSDEEAQRVNEHIASCQDCNEWVQAEIAQTAAIRSRPTKIRKIEKAARKKKAQD
jgi:anti-sigma factor RsiW